MSNPFDNKIKESLENFEMPYDAAAWTELSGQLPAAGGSSAASSQIGWKAAAALVAVVATVATVWYFSGTSTTEIAENGVTEEAVVPESVVITNNEAPVFIEENSEKSALVDAEETATEKNATENQEYKAEQPVPATKKIPAPTEKKESVSKSESATNEDSDNVNAQPAVFSTEKALTASFIPSSVNLCVGEDITFINETSDKSATMSWEFGDGTVDTELNPAHNYVQPGHYTIKLLANNGSKTAEYSVNVTVNPTPMPIFTAERKLDGYTAIPLYSFSTAVQPNQNAVWSFSDGSVIAGTSVNHLFRDAGVSTAKLTVTNNFGCSSSMDQTYETADFNLLAPNTFSPNGDGINESFIPAALPVMGVAFEMSITNPRTGEVVYRTGNAAEGWNGNLNNAGTKLESGIYVWTVVLKDNVLKDKVFNGKINLTR